MTGAAGLVAENLSLRRGGANVLRSVSAEVEAGQITAIVGPNGAGKSSLLMALAGLLDPVGGRVCVDGREITDFTTTERARTIGYLPQDGAVAWDVAVETMVALGRMPHRDARTKPHDDTHRNSVDAAIAALDLDDLRGRPVSRLSGGEKARALLARVLAGEPRWILADEPLAALDIAHQLSLLDHFKHCAKEGVGVIIVLHDLALAMNHADKVIVLDQGRLAICGLAESALAAEVIASVWRTDISWIGEEGSRALIAKRR